MVKLSYCWAVLVLVAIAEAQESDETELVDSSVDDLTEDKCNHKRAGCCSELYIGDEEQLVKCFAIHSAKLPPEGDSDIGMTLRFLSCFVECIYKQKKYIGKGDTINMKMVKLDAEKMYENRPKEKEYHIEMYESCRKDAVGVYNILKASPGAKVLLKGACRPYLLMVFMCMSDYHQKHECPYFRWEGSKSAGTKDTCEDAKAKCYVIDGITLPAKNPA
ncbi:uncharacterized protein LOC108112138 [Drosophila eugracilis]|uniref:uncharacterized protein LOC108112138 n=1 Tax=Drosophila eugracilis TaxID=29029 RepID=UPI0007E6ADC1|nr:uncharacterized protein LOC108112138 [Drosophila eugracilis]